jgi:hypothetical protein
MRTELPHFGQADCDTIVDASESRLCFARFLTPLDSGKFEVPATDRQSRTRRRADDGHVLLRIAPTAPLLQLPRRMLEARTQQNSIHFPAIAAFVRQSGRQKFLFFTIDA